MKAILDRDRLDHSHALGQLGIQRPAEHFRRQSRISLEARYLGQGMHAGIGPAAGQHRDPARGDLFDGVFQGFLDAPAVRLPLPAGEVGAVVGQGEFDGVQGSVGTVQFVAQHAGEPIDHVAAECAFPSQEVIQDNRRNARARRNLSQGQFAFVNGAASSPLRVPSSRASLTSGRGPPGPATPRRSARGTWPISPPRPRLVLGRFAFLSFVHRHTC